MRYRIRNGKGEYFNLFNLSLNIPTMMSEVEFLPTLASYKIKDKVTERYAGYGGVLKGDGKFADRDMNFSFTIATEHKFEDGIPVGQIEHRKILNYISRFFRPENRDFWLENMDFEIETKISHDGIKTKTREGLEYIISENDLPITLIDGLWLGKEVTISGTFESIDSVDIDIDTDSINLPVLPFDAFPIIELTGIASNSNFTLFNETNNYSTRIQENSFAAGVKITLDSVKGEAMLNATLKKKMITDGYFLFLNPGLNKLYYSGISGVNYVIKYRPRYLH